MKNIEVKFPLIEDITMEVSKKYGMIQPGESSTKAVRAVFSLILKALSEQLSINYLWVEILMNSKEH